MALELRIDGYFEMVITDKEGVEVDEKTEKEVLAKLQSGEYLIGISSRDIIELPTMKVKYQIIIEPTDATEYGFDEL